MSAASSHESERERRLHEVIAAYLAAVQASQAIDRDQLRQQHPDLADDLGAFFADHDTINQATAPLRYAQASAERLHYFGDYELMGEIGRGGMGVVHRARQVSLNRMVAIKMIRDAHFAAPEDRKRFRREAENAARLDHPNIVQIFEVGEHEGQQYYSMKLIEGGSLSARLPALKSDPRQCARLLVTLARAVHHAHQRGILHRDLKPGNILLDGAGQPHIADFGFARTLDQNAQHSGQIVGTASYMAPEQAVASKDPTTGIDVYALGAILYEMLTGHPPFQGDNKLQTLRQVIEQDPPRPRSLNRKADADLETICLKCLEKDPKKRYLSAEALAEELERWLRGEPIKARLASRRERILKWIKRRPTAAALIAVSLAALVTLLAGAWQLKEQRDQTQKRLEYSQNLMITMQLRRVAAAWQRDPNQALEWLKDRETCPEQLRDFTWNLFFRLCQRNMTTFTDHTDSVLAVRYSPDGKTLASASRDKTIVLKELSSGKPRLVLRSHTQGVARLSFSHDGKALASGGIGELDKETGKWFRGEVKLWDPATGEELASLEGLLGGIRCVEFSPDGKLLAVVTADEVKLWDPTTRQLRTTLANRAGAMACAVFTPDSSLLIVGIDGWDSEAKRWWGDIQLWDVSQGKQVGTLGKTAEPVTSLAISADGKFLASVDNSAGSYGAGSSGQVKLWDLAQKRQHTILTWNLGTVVPLWGTSVAFSHDGKLVAAGFSDNTVKVWQVASWERHFLFEGHANHVNSIAFSPDDKSLASASTITRSVKDSPNGWSEHPVSGEVKLWDVVPRRESVLVPGRIPIGHIVRSEQGRTVWQFPSVAVAADGKTIASTSEHDDVIRLWDAATGKEFSKTEKVGSSVLSLAISPDGKTVAAGSFSGFIPDLDPENHFHLWDATTGRLRARFRAPAQFGGVPALAFSPDSQTLASGGYYAAKLWDVGTGKEKATLAVNGGFSCLAFAADGRLLYTGDHHGNVSLWDVATTKKVKSLAWEDRLIVALAPDPSGRTVAVAYHYGPLILWDTVTGKQTAKMAGPRRGFNRLLAFTPNGKTLASAHFDEAGNFVKLWNVATGQEEATFRADDRGISLLRFTQDGQVLLAISPDGTVERWEAGTPH
jgi:WD40 repeat protein